MYIILKWLLNAAAIMLASYLVPGIVVSSMWTALWVAFALALINVTIKPILILLTLPINILTLGLFTLVLNTIIILLVSSIIRGFEISSFWNAMLFSIILSVISFILNKVTGAK